MTILYIVMVALIWTSGFLIGFAVGVRKEALEIVENLIRRDPACFNLSDELQSVRTALRDALSHQPAPVTANASAEARWRSLSEDTSWIDGRDVVLLARDMEVQARYCPGEWSDETPNTPREYSGAVWSCFDDQFQLEIEECSKDPSEWGHDGATHWRPVYAYPHASDCDKQATERWLKNPAVQEAVERRPDRILDGLKEALAVTKGEIPAAAIHVNGHKYVPDHGGVDAGVREIVARALCDDDLYLGAWNDEKKDNEGSGRVWPNEKARKYWYQAEAVLSALSHQPAPVAAEDEAYELGKRDGYEDAIQDLDIATGGDGEFKGSTIPGEIVDTETMKQRIVDRCADVTLAELTEWVANEESRWDGAKAFARALLDAFKVSRK